MTSELQSQQWAVLSNRGCEATELTHEKRGVWSIDSKVKDVTLCAS